MKANFISNIGDLFFEFDALIQAYERKGLKDKEYDVTPNEVKVLYLIGLSNNKSMKEIADKLKVTQGTLSITVNSLVKKGYVLRTRHKLDKRIIILYLTKQGINAIKAYEELYFDLFMKLLNIVPEEKVVVLEQILSKLNEILASSLDERDD